MNTSDSASDQLKQRCSMLLMAAAIIFISACSGGGKSAISGHIKGAEGKTIYLEQFVNNKQLRTDSTVIGADGSFKLIPAQGLELNYYWLRLNPKDFVILITDSTECIEIEGEAGKLNSDAKVSGSENTALLRDLEADCQPFFDKEEAAFKSLQNTGLSPEESAKYKDDLLAAKRERTEFIKKWLESNSSTPAAIAAIQMIDLKSEPNVAKKVVADLGKTFSHSIHFKFLKQQVDAIANPKPNAPATAEDPGVMVAPGKPAPEIAMPDPNGKVRKLSDLRGKTVLVDFWASWCGPCRRENPNVVKAYKAYNKDGFEVFSVSLDRSADLWKQAIQSDGLLWPNHVSDLAQWNNKAAVDYGVHSIPFPVLVDKNGNVIAYGNNVRGELLETHLKQIYGH